MTAIEQAIRDAEKIGGYNGNAPEIQAPWELLDPQFWKCLGKARGWHEIPMWQEPTGRYIHKTTRYTSDWEHSWHRFLDHLATGADAESFFKNL